MKYTLENAAKAIKGNRKAFATLYEEIYVELYKMAYYTLGNSTDAEDAVSDAVLDAYKGIKKLKMPEAFGSWMLKILIAKCNRKISYYAVHNKDVSYDEMPVEIAAEQNEKSEEQCDIESAFKVLSNEERMIVSLSFWSGYNSEEIGEVMNLNPSTVRSRQKRALEKMRVRLG